MVKRRPSVAGLLMWRLEIAIVGAIVCWQFVSSIIYGIRLMFGG